MDTGLYALAEDGTLFFTAEWRPKEPKHWSECAPLPDIGPGDTRARPQSNNGAPPRRDWDRPGASNGQRPPQQQQRQPAPRAPQQNLGFTKNASPAKLRDETWGARVFDADVRQGEIVTVTTKDKKKSWPAQVTEVVWQGPEHAVVRIGEVPPE